MNGRVRIRRTNSNTGAPGAWWSFARGSYQGRKGSRADLSGSNTPRAPNPRWVNGGSDRWYRSWMRDCDCRGWRPRIGGGWDKRKGSVVSCGRFWSLLSHRSELGVFRRGMAVIRAIPTRTSVTDTP